MQSRWLVLAFAIMTAALSTATMAASSPPAPSTDAQPTAAGLPVIEVDSLMKAPEKYPGTIRVRGMVRKVYSKKQRLGLIDAHYLGCCTTPCDSGSLLPVTWTGDMPSIRALVLVTGETRQAGGTFEFVAKSLEIVPSPPFVAK